MDKKKTVSNSVTVSDIAPSFPFVQTGNTLTISTYADMPDNSYENWAYSFDDILYVEKEWTDFQSGSLQIDLDGTESAIYFRGMNDSILSSLKAEGPLQSSDLFSITFDSSANFSEVVKSQVTQGFLKWSNLISGIKPSNSSNPTVSHNIQVTVKAFTENSSTVGNAIITNTDTVEGSDFAISGDISLNTNNIDAYSTKFLQVAGPTSNKTYTVTASNGYFYIDGVQQPTLALTEGNTYKFDQSDSTNSYHPLRFSTTSDGIHNSGSEYTTGVTTAGTLGSAGAFTQIVIAAGAPTLYVYCKTHSGMGFQVNTETGNSYQVSILTSIIVHEAAHILGLGTLWGNRGFIKTHANGLKYYDGAKALGEYKTTFSSWPDSSSFIGIPIENDGGAGTAGSHPEEGLKTFVSFTSDYAQFDGLIHPGLQDEINTGFMTEDVYMPLSKISVGFADDLGFVVDYDKADDFVAHDPPSTPTPTPAPPPEGDGITMYFEDTSSVSLPIAQIGWKVTTDHLGNQITHYENDGPDSSIVIDWGDGNTQTLTKGQEGVITKTYASNSGVKTVNITGHLVKYGTYDLVVTGGSENTDVVQSNTKMTRLVIKGMDFLEDTSYSFYKTLMLETVDLADFKSPSLKKCAFMFAIEKFIFETDGKVHYNAPLGLNTPVLKSIDISSMNFFDVKWWTGMFGGQKNLETILGSENLFFRYGNDFGGNPKKNVFAALGTGGTMDSLDGIFSGCDSLASLDLSSYGFAYEEGTGFSVSNAFIAANSDWEDLYDSLDCIYDPSCEALTKTWNAPFMKTPSNRPQWDSFKPYRQSGGDFCNNSGDYIELKFSAARLASINRTVSFEFAHHLLHWAQDSYIELTPNNWGPDPDSEPHVYIDWGEGAGNQDYAWNNSASFTYPDSNTERTIKISGDLSWITCKDASSAKIIGMRSLESASRMFKCSYGKELESLDLSQWDSRNIVSMHEMFYYQNLNALSDNSGEFTGLSNFSSKKLTDMSYLFYKCKMPKKIDLNHINVSKVTDMTEMFRSSWSGCCSAVPVSEGGSGVATQIGISEWRPVNLKYASSMLRDWCEVPDLTEWETPNLRSFIWNGYNPYYSTYETEMRAKAPTSWNIQAGGSLVPHWFNW